MDPTQPIQTPPIVEPQPTEPPQPQQPYYAKRNWKKWLAIYAVIGVLLYAAIYYYAFYNKSTPYQPQTSYSKPTTAPSPTPDPTANWNTYLSTKYGYLIKYPTTWSITDVDLQNPKDTSITINSNEKFPAVANDPEPITYWINI